MSNGGKVFLGLLMAGGAGYVLLRPKDASASTPATPPGGQMPQGNPPGLALPGLPGLTAPLQIPGSMPPVPSIPSTDSNIHASQENLLGAREALRTLPPDVSALCADQWMLAQPSTSGSLGALANWLQANGKPLAAQWMAKRASEALNIAAYPVQFVLYYDQGLTPQVRARLHSALLRQEWETLQGLIEQIRPAAPKTAAGFEALLPDFMKQGSQSAPPPAVPQITPSIPQGWIPGQNPPPAPPPPPGGYTPPATPPFVPPATPPAIPPGILPPGFPSIPGITPPPGMTTLDRPGQPGGLPPSMNPPTNPPPFPPGTIPGMPPGFPQMPPGIIPASYTPPGSSPPPPMPSPPPGATPPPWWPAGVPFVTPPAGTPVGSAPPGMVLPANASWDATSNRIKYIVQSGDTGTKIAQRFGKATPALWAPSVVAANPGKKWGKDGNVHPGNQIWLQPAFGIPSAQPPVTGTGQKAPAPPPPASTPPPASSLPGPDYRWERGPDGKWNAVRNVQA
jgi:hypothetical protein